MKHRKYIIYAIVLISLSIIGCKDGDTSSKDNSISNSEQSNNGIYSYNDSDMTIDIRISGERFSGSHTIKIGMGNDIKERYSGTVRGDELIDGEYGVKLGIFNGKYLRFSSPSGGTVTLKKQ